MKNKSLLALLLVSGFLGVASLAWACSGADEKCSMADKQYKMGKADCSMKKDCDKDDKCPITSKFMKKAHFFLSNSKEIGLSDAQVDKIKSMKLYMKKAMIRQEAEMQVFELELSSKLSEPKVDVQGLNTMIDEAMAGFSASAKSGVQALADLKAVLTEEQMAKAKEIWVKKS